MLREEIESILSALGEQVEVLAPEPLEILVCGGSALNLLGFIRRATKDVDVIAYVHRNEEGKVSLIKADPLRPELMEASRRVARDFNLPENWLNAGPASALDFGLPEGLMERVITRAFGKKLIIHFLGRYDQIHFKLYATADQGAGKHLDDLLALQPTAEELGKAARWSMTHDVSEAYKQTLKGLLIHLGHEDVAKKL
jgi:hypothetical protein